MFQLFASLLLVLGLASGQGLEEQAYNDLYAEAFYYCSGSTGTPTWALEQFRPWEDFLKPQPPHTEPDKEYSMAIPNIIPELEAQMKLCTYLYTEEPTFREAMKHLHEAREQERWR